MHRRLSSIRNHGFFASAASVIAMCVATPALAQTGPAAAEQQDEETIIVTATKREQSLFEVPFSINAQTEEDIQRSGANTIEDLSRNVAGLAIQNLGPGQSQVSVRGVSSGQIVRDQPGVKEQVGVYLDESVISLSLFTPDIDLFDLNRVETLRGPQGTLFGSGSVGGTLRYITNQPDLDSFEGMVEGNVNVVDEDDFGGHLKGMINVPVAPGVAVRAVGYYTQYGGFIDALREGGSIDENVNDGHRVGGRLAVTLEPGSGIRLTPRVVYQEIRTDGFNRQEIFNLYANPFTTTRPPVTFEERQQFLLLDEEFRDDFLLADLTASFDLTDSLALTSITTYIDREILVSRDASALTGSVSVDLGFPDAAVLLPSNLRDTTDLQTFAQELRLSTDSDGPVNWVVGLFFSDTERLYQQVLPTPGYDAFVDAAFGPGTSRAVSNGFPEVDSPFRSELPYDIEQKAAFGEFTFDVTPRLILTAGGRYYDFSETRRIRFGGLFADATNEVDETSSNGFSPRFIATWEAVDGIRFNGQVSKGFRLGGVNDPLNLPLCTPTDRAIFEPFEGAFQDETLWNYEVGVRGERRGINFAVAGYYTDINDLQVTLDAGSCSSRIVFNVPSAHTLGLEAELSAEPIEGWAISLAGSWVEAEFDSTLPEPLATTTGIREGNRLPSVPEFQLTASTSYTFPVMDTAEAYIGASFQHVGSRFTQPSDQENNPRTFVHGLPFGGAPATASTTVDLRLPDYQLVNLSAGVDWDNGLGVMVYVNNLLDENPILAFDRERGGRARLGFHVGQPRTIGVTVRKRFR